MLTIDEQGGVSHPRVTRALRPFLEHGPMPVVHGIVVHQTDSDKAAGTLAQYEKPGSNGAHFLIDKDGKIYQTASVFKKTHHVGVLKSRVCSPAPAVPLSSRSSR